MINENTTTALRQIEYLTQDEVRRECSVFIKNTCMTNKHFCGKIGLSREGFNNWMDGESNIMPNTMTRIMEYLNSQEAHDLLEERKVYKPIKACSQQTKLDNAKIRSLCDNGVIDAKRDTGGHWFPNINDLRKYVYVHHPELAFESVPHPKMLAFGSLTLDPKESWKPVLSAHNSSEIFEPYRYEFDDQILISKDGRLFNCRTRNLIASKSKPKGYIHVKLLKNGKNVSEPLHQMVAYFFCPNRRYLNEVHHINRKKHDNRASNLIWVTNSEHDECHRLMKKDKKAYRKYISKLQKANSW